MYFPAHRAVLKSSSLQTLCQVHTRATDWLGIYVCSSHTTVDLQPWFLRNPCLRPLVDHH